MNPKADKVTTVAADKAVEQGRRAKAKQFLNVAEDVRELSDEEDVRDAVVTLYVHAGIAAADAICAAALGKHAKGSSHHDAVTLLAAVDNQASISLNVLLGMKTRAGYGHDPISKSQLARAEKAARALVDKASL
ncbi:hypothetical protein [Salinibacterium sp. TMP30]|uniref:hypothetical protein n=1 Tax=Salinibacterium sp. TMP30 TaxID=3138237 RepID=UPI0031386F46